MFFCIFDDLTMTGSETIVVMVQEFQKESSEISIREGDPGTPAYLPGIGIDDECFPEETITEDTVCGLFTDTIYCKECLPEFIRWHLFDRLAQVVYDESGEPPEPGCLDAVEAGAPDTGFDLLRVCSTDRLEVQKVGICQVSTCRSDILPSCLLGEDCADDDLIESGVPPVDISVSFIKKRNEIV